MTTAAVKHVFGPVQSRRLGRSLGIDPVPPKTCDFNCVYCQLGRTRRPDVRRRSFYNIADIVTEVAVALARHAPDTIDWITFVGSGETTLYSRLGTLIRFVKNMSELPVAVITNGSLLSLPRVRRELEAADAVLPSLDAGTDQLFRAINRPHRELLFADHVDGMIEFREAYRGRLWIEVMLVGGVNDSERALGKTADVLRRVQPDEIHVTTPTRPPAEPWVHAPADADLERAAALFGEVARVLVPHQVEAALDLDDDLVGTVFSIISRHPLNDDELERLLSDWASEKVSEALAALRKSGKVQVVERSSRRYWCAAELEFPTETEARAAIG